MDIHSLWDITTPLLQPCDPSRRDKKRWKWEEKQFIKIYFTTESLSWKWPVELESALHTSPQLSALIGQLWPSLASDWPGRLNGGRWHLMIQIAEIITPWPGAPGTIPSVQPLMTRQINRHILHMGAKRETEWSKMIGFVSKHQIL